MIQLKDKEAYKLAEEQLDQFLKDNDYMPFEYNDFNNWQKKAYKSHEIEFVYAWWIIRDVMRRKYRHDVDIITDEKIMTPEEVLNELNDDWGAPIYFYDEEKKKFYYKENTAYYTVRGKKKVEEEENEPEEEEAGTTGVGDTEGRLP